MGVLAAQENKTRFTDYAIMAIVWLCALAVLFSLFAVITSSLFFWAGIRVFSKTMDGDSNMIKSFEKFWHDDLVKNVRGTARSLYMISPLLYVMAFCLDIAMRQGRSLGVFIGLAAAVLVYQASKVTLRVCGFVGHPLLSYKSWRNFFRL